MEQRNNMAAHEITLIDHDKFFTLMIGKDRIGRDNKETTKEMNKSWNKETITA